LNSRYINALIGIAIGLPIALVVVVSALQPMYADRMYPGVRVGGIDIGGLTQVAATSKLQTALNAQTRQQVVATYQDQAWAASLSDLGLKYDMSASVANAFKIGHAGNAFDRALALLIFRGNERSIKLQSDVDDIKLDAFVAKIAQAIDRPARDPGVRLSGKDIVVTPGQDGRQLDEADTLAQLRDRLSSVSSSPITLKVSTTSSALNNGDSSATKALISAWTAHSLTVTTTGASETLSGEQIASAIRIGHPENSSAAVPYVDPAALRTLLAPLASAVARPAVNTTYALQNGLLGIVQNGQRGQHLDLNASVQIVSDAITSGMAKADVPLRVDEPSLLDLNDVASVQQSITHITGKPIVAQGAGGSWTLQPKDLYSWIKLDAVPESPGTAAKLTLLVRPEAVRAWVQQIKHDADRSPQDGKVSWQHGSLAFSTPPSDGYQLDADTAVQAVLVALESDQRTIDLPFAVTKPSMSADRLSQLGITDLVGEGTSRFYGSPPERVKNIQRGAELIDGTLIDPGETFSFDDTVGDISLNNGFTIGLVIADHETKDGVGGGICQVSTTVFRAAFWSGLPIVERHDHSYAVPYYTQGGYPEGFDATIYSPELDLKFRNDTSGYLLVQTYVDVAHAKLTVDFFGTKTGRFVKLLPGAVTNVVAHPPDLRRNDPSLPRGVVKQVDWAHDGFDVSIVRVISVDGKQVGREVFASHAQPWRAIFLVGGPPSAAPTPGSPKATVDASPNATPGVSRTPSTQPPSSTPGPSKTPSAATTHRPAPTPTPVA
jgi:vancomycin resistance protein YoaR